MLINTNLRNVQFSSSKKKTIKEIVLPLKKSIKYMQTKHVSLKDKEGIKITCILRDHRYHDKQFSFLLKFDFFSIYRN